MRAPSPHDTRCEVLLGASQRTIFRSNQIGSGHYSGPTEELPELRIGPGSIKAFKPFTDGAGPLQQM